MGIVYIRARVCVCGLEGVTLPPEFLYRSPELGWGWGGFLGGWGVCDMMIMDIS